MRAAVEHLLNKATEAEITEHLSLCDAYFVPPLSGRIVLSDYAKKMVSKAMRFEAWSEGTLVGLVAAYCNDQEQYIAYITSVSVLREWTGKGVASQLVKHCIEHMKALGMRQIGLEVDTGNMPAFKLYKENGFVEGNANASFVTMNLYLKSGE